MDLNFFNAVEILGILRNGEAYVKMANFVDNYNIEYYLIVYRIQY